MHLAELHMRSRKAEGRADASGDQLIHWASAVLCRRKPAGYGFCSGTCIFSRSSDHILFDRRGHTHSLHAMEDDQEVSLHATEDDQEVSRGVDDVGRNSWTSQFVWGSTRTPIGR